MEQATPAFNSNQGFGGGALNCEPKHPPETHLYTPEPITCRKIDRPVFSLLCCDSCDRLEPRGCAGTGAAPRTPPLPSLPNGWQIERERQREREGGIERTASMGKKIDPAVEDNYEVTPLISFESGIRSLPVNLPRIGSPLIDHLQHPTTEE